MRIDQDDREIMSLLILMYIHNHEIWLGKSCAASSPHSLI